jgi:hypothetical protein
MAAPARVLVDMLDGSLDVDAVAEAGEEIVVMVLELDAAEVAIDLVVLDLVEEAVLDVVKELKSGLAPIHEVLVVVGSITSTYVAVDVTITELNPPRLSTQVELGFSRVVVTVLVIVAIVEEEI